MNLQKLYTLVEGTAPNFTTTLREIRGNEPGKQLLDHTAQVPVRTDQQTLQIAQAPQSIVTALNAPPPQRRRRQVYRCRVCFDIDQRRGKSRISIQD